MTRLTFLDVRLWDTGLVLVLLSDGRIMLYPAQVGFTPLFEERTDGVSSKFDAEGFSLLARGDDVYQEYDYNTGYPYKQMPTLKHWLLEQQLPELKQI